MGRIVISTNVTLDGVVEDPDGNEGTRHGGWFREFGGPDVDAWAKILLAEAQDSAALLLGRRSDEWFARRWESRTGEFAARLNGMPKYVVSSTLEAPVWSNSTVLSGDPVTAVAKVKEEVDGDILVYASYQLGRTLIDHDLVDELRLCVFPVALGAGARLFGETHDCTPLRLTDVQTVGEGLVRLIYEPARVSSPVGSR
jgi:dihydrofolate reductase